MTSVRTRKMVVVCLFASLAVSGCTRTGGRIAGDILVGVLGAVAQAAVAGAFRSSSRASYDVPPPMSPCEAKLAEWHEVHQDEAEPVPAHLLCEPNGDWPASPEAYAAAAEEPVTEAPNARTDVPTTVCGGTETEVERCEQQRAAREQQERERKALRW